MGAFTFTALVDGGHGDILAALDILPKLDLSALLLLAPLGIAAGAAHREGKQSMLTNVANVLAGLIGAGIIFIFILLAGATPQRCEASH